MKWLVIWTKEDKEVGTQSLVVNLKVVQMLVVWIIKAQPRVI